MADMKKKDLQIWLEVNKLKPIRTAETKEAGDKITVYGNKIEAFILLETKDGKFNIYRKYDVPTKY